MISHFKYRVCSYELCDVIIIRDFNKYFTNIIYSYLLNDRVVF
jgi:hypothetical protein